LIKPVHSATRQGTERQAKAATDNRLHLYIQDEAKTKTDAFQKTTSSLHLAPALCMIFPSAPKTIGNCTNLLSIQIDVSGDHDTQQGVCQFNRPVKQARRETSSLSGER
jgi:hypothetical protein